MTKVAKCTEAKRVVSQPRCVPCCARAILRLSSWQTVSPSVSPLSSLPSPSPTPSSFLLSPSFPPPPLSLSLLFPLFSLFYPLFNLRFETIFFSFFFYFIFLFFFIFVSVYEDFFLVIVNQKSLAYLFGKTFLYLNRKQFMILYIYSIIVCNVWPWSNTIYAHTIIFSSFLFIPVQKGNSLSTVKLGQCGPYQREFYADRLLFSLLLATRICYGWMCATKRNILLRQTLCMCIRCACI